MLNNYIKIAFRNIRKHFLYSFINIFGLSLGFAAALVVGAWVYHEWNYDRHFDHTGRIYRVGVSFMNTGDMAIGPRQFGQHAKEFPEVEETGLLSLRFELNVYLDGQLFKETHAYYADSTFFDVFSYNFLEGDRHTALDKPNTVVLTHKIARKYFGKTPALGKSILVGKDKKPYTVTGVVTTKAYPSHINADLWLRYEYSENKNWLSANVYNYVTFKKGISVETFEERLTQLVKSRIYPSLPITTSFEKWIKSDGAYKFIPMPITDIHLESDLKFEPSPVGSQSKVYTFGVIAVLIVIIAGINFVNITTARSSIRAKEIGIRKALGSGRRILIWQFLLESMIVSLVALILGLALGELFISIFHKVTDLKLVKTLFADSSEILILMAIALGIGLSAGMYPAFYLSRFEPVKVLNGQLYFGSGNKNYFRNALVFLQFTISICLLTGTLVIYEQLQFMRTKDLGLDKENVLIVSNTRLLGEQQDMFKQAVINQSGVKSASYNKRLPGGKFVMVRGLKTDVMEVNVPVQAFVGDFDMVSTLGFQILKGRDFSKELASDTAAVILNQSAVKALGLKDPVGKKLNGGSLHVIGIVADFNFESLRQNIKPAVLIHNKDANRLAIKFKGQRAKLLLANLKELWQSFTVGTPFEYTFLDQNFKQLMKKDRTLAQAVLLFTILAVIISCLGLYGLSAYITEQRTKEIGIRRVLGASVEQIVILLNKSFTKPVLMSWLLAIPISFILLRLWLSFFAYKIDLSFWFFGLSGLAALGIAWLTVSWQSVKSALESPAESIRNE